MLEEIFIAGEASYATSGQTLSSLRAINFLFGTNGSGKTTVSRVIADPATRPASRLTWSGGRALECLVYNSDFSARNFAAQMPGIFTLGEAEASVLREIEETKAKVADFDASISSLNGTLGAEDGSSGKRKELKDLRAGIEEQCWAIKTNHDPHFQGAFTGLRNAKARFCDRVLAELSGNTAALASVDDLKKRALTVFQEGLEQHARYKAIAGSDLVALELDPILAKKVVGKEDLDIGALIGRLGNSDWVRQGRDYLKVEKDHCPFCQQDIDEEIRKNLEDYFDEAYVAELAAIDRIIESYTVYSDRVLQAVDDALAVVSRHLDSSALQADRDRFSARIDVNKRLLIRKRSEASAAIVLEPIGPLVAAISGAIDTANTSIDAHNAMVENITLERATLTAQIWKFLIEESKATLSAYASAKTNLDKAVSGIVASIASKTEQRGVHAAQLAELEKSVTSVQPTVNEINSTLRSFGFTNFKLATAGDQNHLYEIVRGDGSDATATLSEGERSFITFLYFFHLIKGSTTTSGITNDRVIVFDDPVSSLDSDVLFIVSTLIKQVLDEARDGIGYVKQVFVLTHNIYFHKEVSFDPNRSRECRAHETFWIVRKVGNHSVVVGYDHNPIRTSYELLWGEVRDPNRSKQTIQNTLRRILENYFKILGNLDKDAIVEKFSGRDRQICGSLFSWVNDGSHSVHDDLYVSADDTVIERYLDVFESIFRETNHYSHYEMMMGPEALAAAAEARAARPEIAEEANLSEPVFESGGVE